MISCRRASELASLQLDTTLPLGHRLKLGAHRVICSMCRNFGQQLSDIETATGEFLRCGTLDVGPDLSDEARDRIRVRLNQQ